MTDTLPSELLDCGWKIVHQDDNMTIIETIISGKAVRGS
jgi:hypothetical protein